MTEYYILYITCTIAVTLTIASVILNLITYKERKRINSYIDTLEKSMEKTERLIVDEIAKNRQENALNSKLTREELSNSLKSFNESFLSRMTEIAMLQKNQLDAFAKQLSVLTQINEQRLDRLRNTVEERLKLLQEDNGQKLDQMRAVVDEKLHVTLEKRLGESFKLVTERLELVHKGLGEMQNLASGVGDLKKVLTNIKTRGIWGEVQLESLLEQILSREQYDKNVATKKGSERVEFAIKLPAKDGSDDYVYLPIDAKFPLEDYQRLVDAQEQADALLIDELGRMLENRIKAEAKDIRDKYLNPPYTTDFGILFLPVEGLYAEVLRRTGLCDFLQREYRVVITGPTTLIALLNSLQMGFRSLAVEKRSSEVWSLLGAVKTEFGKFGDILEKTQKKLQEASNTIETATRKTRTIQRKLKGIQELPPDQSVNLLEDDKDNDYA